MRRLFTALVLFLSAFSASAQAVYEYRAKQGVYTGVVSGWHRSKSAAAAELMGLLDSHAATLRVMCQATVRAGSFLYNHHITASDSSGNPTYFRRNLDSAAIANCAVTTTLQGPYAITYDTRDASCPTGYFFEKTFSNGWGYTADPSGPATDPVLPPSPYCDGSCSALPEEVLECNRSQYRSPNGYYEITCTFKYRTTGGICTQKTPDPESPEPPPQDPGGGDSGDGGDPGDGGGDPGDGGGDPGGGGTEDPDGDPSCGGEGQPTCSGSGGGSSTGGSTACTQQQISAGLCSCTTPDGQPSQCGTGGGGTGGTGGEEPGLLCELFPNSFMCQPMGSAGSAQPVEDLGNLGQSSVTPRAGFGPSNAQCPAPQTVYLSLIKRTVTLPWDAVCQWADTVRPIVIALGWLSAMLGVIGFVRR